MNGSAATRAIGAPSTATAQGIEQLASAAFFVGARCPSPSQAAIADAPGTAATATASQIGPTRMTSMTARTAKTAARTKRESEEARAVMPVRIGARIPSGNASRNRIADAWRRVPDPLVGTATRFVPNGSDAHC